MDVTYYVALPFVAADDGVAAGEAVECLSANAAGRAARGWRRPPRRPQRVAMLRSPAPHRSSPP
jgi:hypothetical protein